MDSLLELESVSNFHPVNTDVGRLYRLMMENKSITREEVFLAFNQEKNNSKEYNRTVYKSLKDGLIDGIFNNSFKDLSKIQQAHIRVWKKFAACKILIGSEKKKAAIPLSREILAQAERYGLFDVALSLSKELELHYSIVHPDIRKYHLYRDKIVEYQQLITEETKAQSVYTKLAFSIQKKRPIDTIGEEIKALEAIRETNNEYKFNLRYFVSKAIWCQFKNDNTGLLQVCQNALTFFDGYDRPLPQSARFHFYFKLIPALILSGDYAKAESSVNRCLKLPTVGSYNWHLTLFYLAVIGFYSNKPKIALNAWRLAERTPKRFESAVIMDRWEIIRAYLFYFDKCGKIKMPGTFKRSKFLNEITTVNRDKSGLNMAIIVVELLHLLAVGDRKKYMERCELLPAYIRDNLRKKEDARSRHFLRMLICVEKGDYHPARVNRYAAGYLKKLQSVDVAVSLEVLESELIPFERLWKEVIINYL